MGTFISTRPIYVVAAIAVSITWTMMSPAVSRADQISKFTGFTRPGAPGDGRSNGKIRFLADVVKFRDEAIGATVYYMVLKKTKSGDDPWGTGLPSFVSTFRGGIDGEGAFSPDLDAEAEYLYLYQVVNDRRTLKPVENASIQIDIDLKKITSWGYFNGVGFGTLIKAQQKQPGRIRSVSFNHSPFKTELTKMYASPAQPITHDLGMTLVPTVKGQVKPKKGTGKFAQISWDALDPAKNPSLVMLLADSEFEKGSGSFRAIWNSKSGLQKDDRSTVFGFTSPLKPKFVSVRIQAPKEKAKKEDGKKGGKIKQAGAGIDIGVAKDGLKAAGAVPSPYDVATPVAQRPVAPGLPPAPLLPQVPSLAPPPIPTVGGGGAVAGSAPGFASVQSFGNGFGGGFGSGFGSGDSSSQGEAQQTQQAQQAGKQLINFEAILINQQVQFQKQLQLQLQIQKQKQSQTQDGNGIPAVPAPSVWLLTGLGLPIVFWMRRRQLRLGT